jgi:carbon-monoxide dehydrogenase large subunit
MVKATDAHAETLARELDAPADSGFRAIGQPIRRKEDHRMLTGAGQFSDDFSADGEVYAAMVRSPHPHARILGVDGAAALAMPGVLVVLSGADCVADGITPIPHSPVPSTKFDMKLTGPGGAKVYEGPHMLLPADKARHVGEAVAMVVAETRELALDAVEAVVVNYEELPWVGHSEDAMEPDAPLVWDEAANNILVDTTFGDVAATDAAFEAAAHVISREFNIGRVTGVPLEPRAALGVFDEETGRLTLYAGSGGAVRQKGELATVLGMERDDIRVLSFDVGGNFGTRNRIYVEFGLVAWAARKLKRPVKFTASRSESFLSDYQGRDLVTKVSLAMDEGGRFLALRATNISNAGARCVSLSPLAKGSALITGSYDIPVATLQAMGVFTNTAPTQAYRSSGRPEVNFALERLIDIACGELGFDRIELRRKNLIASDVMPYRNAMDTRYDSGTYETNMDLAMRLADWDGFEVRREAAMARDKLLGRALSNYVESSTGAPKERTEITVKPEGAVDVVIGTQPSGQGHETSFAQVVSDMLRVPVAVINIIMGDTDLVSLGGGSHSGRSMRHAGTVMCMAAEELVEKGRQIAAIIFDTRADQVEFSDGRFRAPDSNRALDFLELARAAATHEVPGDLAGGLAVVTDNEMHEQVFPNGCAVCEIEIDPLTGASEITRYTAVDDVGRCINPLIVHGQTHGGIAQGVGQALWEQCHIDPGSGQPLMGSFMDYSMPRSDNMPSLKTEIVEVLSPTNPLGIKAGGEGGTTPAPSVVIGAIADALKDYGIENLDMPATPLAVWRAIQDVEAST